MGIPHIYNAWCASWHLFNLIFYNFHWCPCFPAIKLVYCPAVFWVKNGQSFKSSIRWNITVGWEGEEGEDKDYKTDWRAVCPGKEKYVFYLGEWKRGKVHVYLREEYNVFPGTGRLCITSSWNSGAVVEMNTSGQCQPLYPTVTSHWP